MTGTCWFVNVNGTCAFSSPLSELENLNGAKRRACHHVDGKYCRSHQRFLEKFPEIAAYQDAVSDPHEV